MQKTFSALAILSFALCHNFAAASASHKTEPGLQQHEYPSGTKFECLSVKEKVLFDLEIIDIGDAEGKITINDGGAPKTLSAYYERGQFIFGDDSEFSVILADPIFYAWTTAQVEYTNVYGEVVCKIEPKL